MALCDLLDRNVLETYLHPALSEALRQKIRKDICKQLVGTSPREKHLFGVAVRSEIHRQVHPLSPIGRDLQDRRTRQSAMGNEQVFAEAGVVATYRGV